MKNLKIFFIIFYNLFRTLFEKIRIITAEKQKNCYIARLFDERAIPG